MGKAKRNDPPGKLAPGQWEKDCEPCGKLRGDAGEASGDVEGIKETFELSCAGFGGPGMPIIRCKRTGLYYTVSWSDLVNLAIAAGITREHPDMEGK